MKETKPTLTPLAKVSCKFFGHKLKVTRNITNHVHEYKCCKCGVELTDTADGLLARLTPKFKETNAYLAKIHRKRKKVFSSGYKEVSLEG
ncbi:hypothetical protein [Christiangramia salexigens]|uniref:Uncharacterized protein n=1 Tax=Christiangramia salexigens TaxID=1913577 RepID=A0A1L3J745_9FLAO|nr:hypothetical protein [Christiangramia salexigens]APG60931.1 hypothetical protein LPB144_11155 [Christiangramia salexigens]